jgi:anti-sigma B factor antagonist
LCQLRLFLVNQKIPNMNINTKEIQAVSEKSEIKEAEVTVKVLEINGDIDGKTAPQVQGAVLPLVTKDSVLLLDLTQVSYMSSAGLRVLLSLHRKISTENGKLVLVGVAEEIQETMSITGFIDFFTLSPNIDEALATLLLAQRARSAQIEI